MSDKQWFYAIYGKQNGPVTETQIKNMFDEGQVNEGTLFWTEEMLECLSVSEMSEIVTFETYRKKSSPPHQDNIAKALEYTKKSILVNSDCYNHLINLISHPAAIMRLQQIPDSRELQIKLNKTISNNRKAFWLAIIIGGIGIYCKSLILIVLSVLTLLIWYFVLQPKQTLLNIELGAWLFAIDGNEKPEELYKSYEAMNQLYRNKYGKEDV